MTDDLSALPEDVRGAIEILDLRGPLTVSGRVAYRAIRAELLRLARNDADARIALDADHDWKEMYERAKKAEAELAEARETIKRLNRRVQVAEAGVADKVKASGGGFGRSLANAAAAMFMRERDEARAELAALKARIAESAHVEVTLGCAIDGGIPPDLALCKVALVKVEE